jgi:adenylate cyclase
VSIEELRAAGLYDPEAPDGEERLALLKWLLSEGATVAQMVEAQADARLIAVGGDLVVFPTGRPLTALEVADRAGVTIDVVERVWRALGLGVPGAGEPAFTDADVLVFSEFRAASELLEERAVLEFVRVLGSSLARIAEAASAIFGSEVFVPLRNTTTLLERGQLDQLGRAALMRVPAALDPLFRHVHYATMRRANRAFDPTTADTIPLTVGFVDLVGFTPLSQRLSTIELTRMVTEFEAQATDLAAAHDARVVKLIGDEVMFVALDPTAGCQVALGLTESFHGDEGRVTPRGGVTCGRVLARGGDYYGPTVNLASRIADLAVPDEILADEELRLAVEEAEGPFSFESAGRRMVKGFDKPIALSSVHRN